MPKSTGFAYTPAVFASDKPCPEAVERLKVQLLALLEQAREAVEAGHSGAIHEILDMADWQAQRWNAARAGHEGAVG